jgi:large exoprotein involved in heme utilization and adhesion
MQLIFVRLLTADLIDDSQQVAAGCSSNQGSSFVITGRGGIPQNPNDRINLRTWADLRAVSASSKPITSEISPSGFLREATSWHRNPQTGKVE